MLCLNNTSVSCSKAKPRYGDESSEHTVTSDDSASIDAAPMRLFVASPPDRDRSASGAALMEDHLGYGRSLQDTLTLTKYKIQSWYI